MAMIAGRPVEKFKSPPPKERTLGYWKVINIRNFWDSAGRE